MADKTGNKKVSHLKNNNGSWTYRRRVPERHHETLGFKMWNRPCGDVSYQEAVVMVTKWAREDDLRIKELDNPEVGQQVRLDTEHARWAPYVERLTEGWSDLENDPEAYSNIVDADGAERVLDIAPIDPLQLAKEGIMSIDANRTYDDAARLVRYQSILTACFGEHIDRPTDLDKRDEFELVKRKLERRVADLAGDPNTISAVAENYYKNNQIKPGVLRKYRGNISKLTASLGDIPISHVTPAMLRRFRDEQAATMKPSSLASVFTPIRGMFTYAIEEELITTNPAQSVKLPKDKRSIHEKKWTPFPPKEMQRLLSAMDQFWGEPRRGLSDERRLAIFMVCRVMAYSAMRPVEVIRLEPEDVSDEWIKVRESKTPSSYRTIPLHPKISDFPAFVANDGLSTFRRLKTDQVEPVRYNFRRLTRNLMDPPISDKKKVVYSLRSTFSNAMRRAGAGPDVRRAILGHSEGGHLSHYDDGPEFVLKRKWVNLTDPSVIYENTDDYYDDGLGND
ncbi:phage integrase SAM-like domain-containing protein [Ascidiaceihabitans sp.]|uniref:site-specific integrase n=1 Tax=Ascidiaceihabitans sp. TaxID=1872644 RepID=UPI003296F9CE